VITTHDKGGNIMDPRTMVNELKSFKEFFDRASACLTEDDSGFAPVKGMMTVAQTVAHVAQTVDWFMEGAFRADGFDLDFEKHGAKIAAVSSLSASRDWLARSFAAAEKTILEHSAEEWAQPLPEGTVMGGAPRFAIMGGINDHTAHHRGALSVYSRLRGHVPAMPYM
jgi:uncharacterized damage-inducible protein DinB